MPSAVTKRPLIPSTEKFADAVAALLKAYKIDSAPVNVEKIAKALGAQLRYSPLDDELSGMIYIKDDVPIIGVNALHHPNRQRFTIAHEIGHLQLHKDILSGVVHVDKQFATLMRDTRSSQGNDDIEVQANQFAAELLMPANLLLQDIQNDGIDIDDDTALEALAKKYKVSKVALVFRLGNLTQSS